MCVSNVSDVFSPVWSRELGSSAPRHPEVENLPNEVCLRDILGVSRWNMLRNTVVLERTAELPVADQLRQRCLQWMGHLWKMPDHRIKKKLMICQPTGGGDHQEEHHYDGAI